MFLCFFFFLIFWMGFFFFYPLVEINDDCQKTLTDSAEVPYKVCLGFENGGMGRKLPESELSSPLH